MYRIVLTIHPAVIVFFRFAMCNAPRVESKKEPESRFVVERENCSHLLPLALAQALPGKLRYWLRRWHVYALAISEGAGTVSGYVILHWPSRLWHVF